MSQVDLMIMGSYSTMGTFSPRTVDKRGGSKGDQFLSSAHEEIILTTSQVSPPSPKIIDQGTLGVNSFLLASNAGPK